MNEHVRRVVGIARHQVGGDRVEGHEPAVARDVGGEEGQALHLGDLDKGLYRLVTWTRDATIDELCANQGSSLNPGPNCCDAYGHGCWSGYKRLWCNARGVRCVAALPLSCFVWQPSCLGLRLTESIYMDV